MKRFVNKNFSKGGLLGGIFGTVVSTHYYKPDESVTHNAMKTTLFAGLGYWLGVLIENWFRKRRNDR